jgi:hypothetical protein
MSSTMYAMNFTLALILLKVFSLESAETAYLM